MAPSGVSEELSSLLTAVGEMRQSNKLPCVRHKQDYAQQHVARSAGPEAVSVRALLPAPADILLETLEFSSLRFILAFDTGAHTSL